MSLQGFWFWLSARWEAVSIRRDWIPQKRTCGEEERGDESESGEPGLGLLQEDRGRGVGLVCRGCWEVEPAGSHSERVDWDEGPRVIPALLLFSWRSLQATSGHLIRWCWALFLQCLGIFKMLCYILKAIFGLYVIFYVFTWNLTWFSLLFSKW